MTIQPPSAGGIVRGAAAGGRGLLLGLVGGPGDLLAFADSRSSRIDVSPFFAFALAIGFSTRPIDIKPSCPRLGL